MASTPIHGFTKAIEERTEPRPVVSFYLRTTKGTDEEGNPIVYRYDEFHATQPSEDVLLLLLANAGRKNATLADEAASMFDLFRKVLPANEFRVLEKRFEDDADDGVDYEMLGQVFQWLMEQWQDFPTQPPVGSSGSRSTTGKKSTGRSRGAGSISSNSR